MIHGGSFWFFPEFFTLSMFPDIADNQDAIDVGVALRKNMGVGSAFIGLILFSCQTSSKSIAQRSLTCRLCVAPMMEWTDRHCRYFLRRFQE